MIPISEIHSDIVDKLVVINHFTDGLLPTDLCNTVLFIVCTSFSVYTLVMCVDLDPLAFILHFASIASPKCTGYSDANQNCL
jgi:hypothetical protein